MSRDERELNWQPFQQYEYPEPAPDLSPYVARYWTVKWDYAEPYRQLIVPYPNVHLSFRHVDELARRLGTSVRQLQRLFECRIRRPSRSKVTIARPCQKVSDAKRLSRL